MTYYLLIASLIVTGLHLATVAYRAGMRQYGYAIGVTNILGYSTVAAGYKEVGLVVVLVSVILVLVSRHQMKRHCVGPFAQSNHH